MSSTSCFVTHQTISDGDECIVIPVNQSSTSRTVDVIYNGAKKELYGATDSTCYPHAFWNPIGFTFDCKFVDGGEVRLSNTPTNKFSLLNFISHLLAYGGEIERGLSFNLIKFISLETPQLNDLCKPERILPSDPEALWLELLQTWDYIWETSMQHQLFCRSYRGVFPLEFAVVHKSAYTLMGDSIANTLNWKGQSMAYEEVFNQALMEFNTSAASVPNPLDETSQYIHMEKFRVIHDRIGRMTGLEYMGELGVLQNSLRAYLQKDVDNISLFQQLKSFMELRYFVSALDNLNIRFMPLIWVPNDSANEIGRQYLKLVGQVVDSLAISRKS